MYFWIEAIIYGLNPTDYPVFEATWPAEFYVLRATIYPLTSLAFLTKASFLSPPGIDKIY